jgi:methylmalonyl-CoA mutase cobalamin-binding domain/chain
MSTQHLLEELRAALVGEAGYDEVTALTERLIAGGVDPLQAIGVASDAMREIGDQFAAFEIFLPDLMIAGEKMKRCMALLQPHIQATSGAKGGGKVVIGTVSGDLHDIGKNLVATMLAVGGFEVVDLGVNVPPLEFVKAGRDQRAAILALSSLMTASLPYQKEVLDLLKEMGLRDRQYVIVGGGPVTPEYAARIGADGWAGNAAQAVTLCKQLVASGQTPPVPTIIV